MIRAALILIGAFLTSVGIYFVLDGRRKVEGNLIFAGAAVCLIAISIVLFGIVNPTYALR